MIKHVEYSEIDKKKWDDCIERSFNGIIYAFSWYLDIVTDYQWEALIEGDYERVFPFLPKKKYGLSYVYQPFAVQQLGVFSIGKLDQEKVDEFLLILKKKYKIINIKLNVNNKISASNFNKIDQVTYNLDLISPYSMIQKSYSTNHKRNIKKSQSAKLTIVKSIKPSRIIELFKNTKGRTSKELRQIDYDLYQRLVHSAIFKSKCVTYGVLNDNRDLIAGAIFLHSHNRVIYSFSGVNSEGKELRAMFFLMDTFIQEHQSRNLLLDFEGSNDENVAYFYRGFGAKKVFYSNIISNQYPIYLQRIIKFIQRISS